MQRLSIVQEYVLLALKRDGHLPLTDRRVMVCILAGSLVELKLSGSIRMDVLDRIVAGRSLPPELEYLRSLHDWVRAHEPVTVDDLSREYVSWNISGRMDPLLQAIGNALAEKDAVYITEGSVFTELPGFVPKPHVAEEVILKLRRELLDLTGISRETAILADLLEKSGSLKRHFYMYEVDEMEGRLKDIKKYDIPLVWSDKWRERISDWLTE